MRLQHLVGEFTVVGEKYQAHGVIFEAADGKNAQGNSMKKIAQAAAAFGVNHRRNYLGRLVEDQISALGFRLQQLALHFDVIFGFVSLRAQFGDGLPVHGDHAGGDEFFGVAA